MVMEKFLPFNFFLGGLVCGQGYGKNAPKKGFDAYAKNS